MTATTNRETHSATETPADNGPLTPSRARDGLTVRLVGLGGVGSIVARFVSIFLAALQCDVRLILIEGDHFEPQNATRMLFRSCGNKAEVVQADLLDHFADSRLTLMAISEFITPQNIATLLPGGEDEVIFLCVDNHATRKLISDHCEGLDNICLISGGNDGVGKDSTGTMRRGSYGNCQVYIRRGAADVSPSLTAFHDEIKNPTDQLPDDQHCTDLVDSVPQLLFANLATASAICNTFLLYLCDRLHYSEVGFDIVDARMRPLGIPAPVWQETE